MIFRSFLSSPTTKQHVERRILRTNPLHLFRIICNVDEYSLFLPLCTHSKIIETPTEVTSSLQTQHMQHNHYGTKYNTKNNVLRNQQYKYYTNCSNSNNKNDNTQFDASLSVGFPPFFEETYVSRVQVTPSKLMVESRSIESKNFDSLYSRWILREIRTDNMNPETNDITTSSHYGGEPKCEVDFKVEMTVSDPIITQVLDQVLHEVAGKQVEAFERRCHQVAYDDAYLQSSMS